MKKFEFSLSKLQNYKEQVLESEKNSLGYLRKELRELNFQLEELIKLIDMKSDELEFIMLRSISPADFAARKRFINVKQQEGHELRRMIAFKEQEIENQLQVVIEQSKEVNTLDKLEERQYEEYQYVQMKEEEIFIEEFVSNQSSRKRIMAG
jgi:flagellar FliJ protein